MAKTKTNPISSILPRFSGVDGKKKLREIIRMSSIAAGDATVADELINVGIMEEVKKNKKIILQDNSDNDLFIIVAGSFDIIINSRAIAKRKQGQSVGEMALVDSVARRSATVTAAESSIVLRITEQSFSPIANKHPEIWRRLAVELSDRLRQRNSLISLPRTEPVIFIASSSEGLPLAEKIRDHFSNDPFIISIWSEGVFRPTSTVIEDLVKAIMSSDFAIIVITPDDITTSRSITKNSPRDNVLFEFGLFIGHLGRERTFFIHERGLDIKIPSDLLGVNGIIFNSGKPNTQNKRIAPCIETIRGIVKSLGPI